MLFTQEQRLDQTVFEQTTQSIRNLQAQDKSLSLLLNESRYTSTFDHERITDTNYEISEEFDNLRYDALFEEIEASPGLNDAVEAFSEKFVSREEELETYIETNSRVAQSLLTISQTTQSLLTNEGGSELNGELLWNINSAVYQLTYGVDAGAVTASRLVDEFLPQLNQFESVNESTEALEQYKSAISTFVENHQTTVDKFSVLADVNTSELIDEIENEYTLFHNQAISGSNQFRNALIIYGICLLTALLFFGFQIRKNFLFLEQEVADRTEEIETAYKDLQESQEQLIQSEKMASLGQMVAGVAHEINTPLGYVTSNVDTLKLNIEELTEIVDDLAGVDAAVKDTARNNKDITQKLLKTLKAFNKNEAPEIVQESGQLITDGLHGLKEISKLVLGLKDFSRLDRQASEQININDCIESALKIANNSVIENRVDVVKRFEQLPKITCFPSKLNQLFLNVINNACQAMKETGGELIISTKSDNDHMVIEFQDQGVGMDEDTLQHIFDPFFTSKEIGEGTGLGMSIAYKIVQAHNGEIKALSKVGQGSIIEIKLPFE